MKLAKRRRVGERGSVVVSFPKGRPVLSNEEIHLSKSAHDVARWEVKGGKVVRIEFAPGRGCPVTGFDWADPLKIFSGPVADGVDVPEDPKERKPYEYTLVVMRRGVERPFVIDPRIVIDP